MAIRFLESTYPGEVNRLREFIYLKFKRIPFFRDGAFWLNVRLCDLPEILTQICSKLFGWRRTCEVVASLYLEGVGIFLYVTDGEGRVLKEVFKKAIVSIDVKRTFTKNYIEIKLSDGSKQIIPLSYKQVSRLQKKLNLLFY